MSDFQPKPEHKFTFGLWTVGNPGRDPFGEPRARLLIPMTACAAWPNLAPTASICTTTTWCLLAPTEAEKRNIVKEFKKTLKDYRHESADGDD